MGLFSGIVDSVRSSISSVLDSTASIVGHVSDMFKPDTQPIEYKPAEPSIFGSAYELEIEDLYTDYIDWIDSFWY